MAVENTKKINYYPQIIILKGFGTFSSGELVFDSHFEVVHYPQNTIITTKIKDRKKRMFVFANMTEYWELKGTTEENFTINAKNLLFSNFSGNILTLFSFKDFTTFKSAKGIFSSAEFPLVGHYIGDFNFKIDDWEIICSGDKERIENIKKTSLNWNVQLEGLTLKLNKANTLKEKFLSVANDVTTLLSLATGNDIVFNRQKYYSEGILCAEDWSRKHDDNFGAGECVPYFALGTFFEKTYTYFEKWDDTKRLIFYSSVTGINSSSKGFLEDRILRICVVWEGLALQWVKQKKRSETVLNPLKESLFRIIDEYDLPKNIKKDFIRTRVSDSLDWLRAVETLNSLAIHYSLNSERLKLDFETLIKIRNEIAHTGLFKKKYSTELLLDLIYNHKFALQIMLLLELKYDGLVINMVDKWKKHTQIDEFLNPC